MVFACLQENQHYTNKSVVFPAEVLVMSKTLVLPDVTMEDKGIYNCRAEVEPTIIKNVSRKVLVFGECALNVIKIGLLYFFGIFYISV